MQTLEHMAEMLNLAKQREYTATEERIAIENEIIAMTGLPEEGSATHEAGLYKLTVTNKINRKIDEKAWAVIKDKIPEQLWPVRIEEVLKVETKGVRWLKEHEQGYYKLLCQAMEEKPAKPAVKLEVE